MTPGERAQQRLEALAVRLEPRLREAFRRAVAAVGRAELDALVRRLEAASADEVAGWLFAQPQTASELAALRAAYADGILRLAAAEAAQIGRVLRIRVVAPVVSAPLIEAVRRWENGAFSAITAELRTGLRDVVATELARGVGPRQVAVALKQGLGAGLTPYDLSIVRSFREALESGRYRDALRRTLRDRRSDRTLARLLREGKTLSKAQVDRMVAAYERKLVAWRAETFARTNAIQAANEATAASWRAAVEQGVVPAAEVRRYWIVARDERLCPVCAQVPLDHPAGIGLDESFLVDDVRLYTPPAHPNCRCLAYVRHEPAGERPGPAPGTNVLQLPKLPRP